MPDSSPRHHHIVIAGTGFSGVGAAIRLKQSGHRDLVLLERADGIGGVWRDNSYPGAACDVESHLYSFSFAPNPRWSHAFSRQPEILEYLRACAERYDVMQHVRFRHEVTSARWDQAARRWHIETTGGAFTADFFIAAVGILSEPHVPTLPGLDQFRGRMFHSARWDHDYDLAHRKVAVIGTGASAVQFVPEIQPKVEKLTLFQRTPARVLPRWDEAFSERQKRLFSAVPGLQKLLRNTIYLRREIATRTFAKQSTSSPELTRHAQRPTSAQRA